MESPDQASSPTSAGLWEGTAIQLWDQRLSSTEAHRHLDAAGGSENRRDVIDQVAAVLILLSFLKARR